MLEKDKYEADLDQDDVVYDDVNEYVDVDEIINQDVNEDTVDEEVFMMMMMMCIRINFDIFLLFFIFFSKKSFAIIWVYISRYSKNTTMTSTMIN